MMNNTNKIPELLAPAGSFDALCAAVQGGADAVYFGGKTANARNTAKNFTDEEVAYAIKYLHGHNKYAYITLNTLHTDREINMGGILKFAEHCYISGADAFILQDLGLSQIIRKYFPEIKLHASTQAAGHNTDSARRFSEIGFSRMVIARELDLCSLRELILNSPVEIEMFIHGALCSSHSGRCFMSFALGNTRSANRGMCAQPCRMQYSGINYNNGYALSLKDLCLANHIEDIIKLAPKSLKIEGRMKPPEYVYNVCKIYRECLDGKRNAEKQEIDFLTKIFSRQGFTDGYFTKNIGTHMYGVRTDANKRESKKYVEHEHTNATNAINAINAIAGTRRAVSADVKFCVTDAARRVHARYPIPQQSNIKNIKINPKLCLIFDSPEQFEQVFKFIRSDDIIRRIYKIFIPLTDNLTNFKVFAECAKLTEKTEKTEIIGVRLPYVIFDGERGQVARDITAVKNAGINTVLIDNIGHIDVCKEANLELFGNFGLNVTNSYTLDEYKKMGFKDIILSPELNFAQIRDISKVINCGIVAYGRTHVMISENCVIKNNVSCMSCMICMKDKGRVNSFAANTDFYLTDRTGAKFLVRGEKRNEGDVQYGHRNIIYNSVPVYLADKKDLYRNLGLFFITLNFTDETPEQIKKIIEDYAYTTERNSMKNIIKPPEKFTRGYK